MPALKNTRHEAFAQGLAKGLTADAAYEEAGFRPHRGNAARLRANENVQRRVKELTEKAAEKAVVTRAWVLEMLAKNARECAGNDEALRNPAASNKALELLGKELGMFVDRRLVNVRNISDMSEEEILELLGGEPDPEELSAAAGSPAVGHA